MRTANGHQPITILSRRVLRTTCPHCARLRVQLLCWKLGATFLVVFLIVLLTVVR